MIKVGCDIDIDNLSLSGLFEVGKERFEILVKLINLFIEFVIKNFMSVVIREVMGFCVSVEKIVGLFIVGINDGI